MLFKRDVLDGIVAGRIMVAFRRWVRPSVRAGTTLRTAAGVVRITGIAAVSQAAITSADAKQAGFPSRAKLLDSLAGRDGTLKTRMQSTQAAGNTRAKTGSFSIANNLSGYITTRDGHRLAVSVMTNFANTTADARRVQDEIFAALAEADLMANN